MEAQDCVSNDWTDHGNGTAECASIEGIWLGLGVSCQPENPCFDDGACCAPDGTCTITRPLECTGGMFLGVGSTCDPNFCPGGGVRGIR